jgi:site-specific recombinase XerD
MRNEKKYSPIPLFDNLRYLKSSPKIPTLIESDEIKKADFMMTHYFLYNYRGSEATFNAYRREIERFLHWLWYIQKKNLQTLHRSDMENFIEFCQDPPADWIGISNVPRFYGDEFERTINLAWRPFVAVIKKAERAKGATPQRETYLLSQKAIQAIFSILGSFFNFLIQEEYTHGNPIAQMRQKSRYIRKQQQHMIIRRLTELQWSYVIETAGMMATENPTQHERTLFIMQALYGMYLRISELAASSRWEPQMGHFQSDQDGNWWFLTVGKGNKERRITVSHAMLNALKRYRISLGLSTLPTAGETTPLILNFRTHTAITSTRHIREIVQNCFDTACDRLKSDGFRDEAEQLMAATVHWLRHTGISEDVKTRPREHVRDDAGHASSAITDQYIDVELRERHASGKHKQIIP